MGAQAQLGVDQRLADLLPARRLQGRVGEAHRRFQVGPDRQPNLARLRLPPAGQQARGQRVILPAAGSQGCFVIRLHTQRRRLIQRPLGLQLRLDLGAALGERSQLSPAETFDLPRVVAVRTPAHPQPQRQRALQLVLVDRTGRPGPLEQRSRVKRHVPAVGRSAHQVGDQTVGVQLRVALPARSVHEPGHHPTLGGHPPAHPLRLHPGHRGVFLQKVERGIDRLPVGRRHLLRHRLRRQRPQQRHALGAREGQVERSHRTRPGPRKQVLAGHRVLPLDHGAQLVGLHHPRQPETLGPPAGPYPRRLAHPARSTRRCSTPPTRSDTPHSSTPSPSTLHSTTNPITIHHNHHHHHHHHTTTTTTITIHLSTDTCHPSGEATRRRRHGDTEPKSNVPCPGRRQGLRWLRTRSHPATRTTD